MLKKNNFEKPRKKKTNPIHENGVDDQDIILEENNTATEAAEVNIEGNVVSTTLSCSVGDFFETKKSFKNGYPLYTPDWQREPGKWNLKRRQKYIESLLAGIPSPPIYMYESEFNNSKVWLLLDGVQRIDTIQSFAKGEFSLPKGSKSLWTEGTPEYKIYAGKKTGNFDNLYREFAEKPISVFQIKKPTSGPEDNFKYEIFNRLNFGAVRLKSFEILRATYPDGILKKIEDWLEDQNKDKTCIRIRENLQALMLDQELSPKKSSNKSLPWVEKWQALKIDKKPQEYLLDMLSYYYGYPKKEPSFEWAGLKAALANRAKGIENPPLDPTLTLHKKTRHDNPNKILDLNSGSNGATHNKTFVSFVDNHDKSDRIDLKNLDLNVANALENMVQIFGKNGAFAQGQGGKAGLVGFRVVSSFFLWIREKNLNGAIMKNKEGLEIALKAIKEKPSEASTTSRSIYYVFTEWWKHMETISEFQLSIKKRKYPQKVLQTKWDSMPKNENGKRVCAKCNNEFEFDIFDNNLVDGDHIIPDCAGGEASLENLQLLHKGCNRSIGAKTF